MEPTNPHIAPLNVVKGKPNISVPTGSDSTWEDFTPHDIHIGPSSTLLRVNESNMDRIEPPGTVFHHYLRAFCPFHPPGDASPTAVTLPLDQGDITLVHSVHTNGWADGTLLDTGGRGWLPTNYCEPYDQLPMRPLLKAMMDFWDATQGECELSLRDFGNQDLTRGLVAGIRFLLVSFLQRLGIPRADCRNRRNPNASPESRLW